MKGIFYLSSTPFLVSNPTGSAVEGVPTGRTSDLLFQEMEFRVVGRGVRANIRGKLV